MINDFYYCGTSPLCFDKAETQLNRSIDNYRVQLMFPYRTKYIETVAIIVSAAVFLLAIILLSWNTCLDKKLLVLICIIVAVIHVVLLVLCKHYGSIKTIAWYDQDHDSHYQYLAHSQGVIGYALNKRNIKKNPKLVYYDSIFCSLNKQLCSLSHVSKISQYIQVLECRRYESIKTSFKSIEKAPIHQDHFSSTHELIDIDYSMEFVVKGENQDKTQDTDSFYLTQKNYLLLIKNIELNTTTQKCSFDFHFVDSEAAKWYETLNKYIKEADTALSRIRTYKPLNTIIKVEQFVTFNNDEIIYL